MTTTRCIAFLLLTAAVLSAALAAAPSALAAERTVVLTLPDMECASSEMRARMALTGIEGV